MEFRILGPLEVVGDDGPLRLPTGHQRALLALLVIHANRVLSPDRIVEAVWGDRPPPSGTKALAFHLSRLRDALAPGRARGSSAGVIATEPGGYVLRVDPETIDAVRFERLASDGHELLVTRPDLAGTVLDEALGLWRGDVLGDVAYAEFAQAEIRRLEELRLAAQEDRLEARMALGEDRASVPALEALLAANPLRERARGLLMLALYRAGRQAEALRVAGAGRRLLSEELGIDPSPELVQLEARMLRQDSSLDRPVATAARPRNPYKGLRAFGEADQMDFHGREAVIGRLVARVLDIERAGRLLVVAGPSGSGKSSVVRAGLVPALRASPVEGRPRHIATMLPGTDPVRELAAALAAIGGAPDAPTVHAALASDTPAPLIAQATELLGPLVLVVDQLEELFVRVEPTRRQRFLDGIAAALESIELPLVVVATLRADFLHVPLGLDSVGELVRDGTELLAPMTRTELERAIVRPAAGVGVEVDPGLVADLVRDVEHRPGALPLLQYALTEVFDGSDGRRLTREGYESIGGVTGALGRQADAAWRAMDADSRGIARRLLLALVEVVDGSVTTRRATRSELRSMPGDTDRVPAILDQLAERGLLTFDLDRASGAPTVQIAHEALLVHWSRLSDWIDDLRSDLATRHRLTEAAREWDAGDRAVADLATGTRLERFDAWARSTGLPLGDPERTFLDASTTERRRRRRRSRLGRALVAGALAVAIVAAGALSVALAGRLTSEQEGEAVARARELAVASLGATGDLRLLLALEAADATTGRGYVVEEAYDALQWALQDARVTFPAGDLPVGVRAAPDGPRGVFLLAPGALLRLASTAAGRSLTPDECRSYLHRDACPSAESPSGREDIGVRTVAGVVAAPSLAVGSMVGTGVSLWSELPTGISLPATPGAPASDIRLEVTAGGDRSLVTAAGPTDLPDLAIVTTPSSVATAARQGLLIDLTGRAGAPSDAAGLGDYIEGLGRAPALDGSGAGGAYGLPLAASLDDLLWYPRAAFAAAGYQPPTDRAALDDLVRQLRADGNVPWCFGVDAGDPTETAAAAWVEDAYLDAQGLAAHDRWTAGDTPFETPAMHAALDSLGADVMPAGAVFRNLDSALRTPHRIAGLPMVSQDPPGCWLFRGSSTDAPLLSARAAAIRAPAPTGASRPAMGRVYQLVILRDRPEVRRVAEALAASARSGALVAPWCDAGIFPIAADVPDRCGLASEADRLRAAIANQTFRVRATDLLPGDVGPAFEGDITSYLLRWATDGIDSRDTGFSADGAWAELRAEGLP